MNAIRFALAVSLLVVSASSAWASVQIGQAAPEITLNDVSGKAVKLSDFKGKHVVLEWTNPHCPFVKKHYESKNMQGLQSNYTGKGVVWLAINSTAPDHQDFMKPTDLGAKLNAWGSKPSATLMDADGKAGKAYGAKTTPHMYIVDPAGKLVYAGGIDDRRSANPADIPSAKNFVRAALDESLAGKPVSVATATPYGCSVKYN